MRVGSFSNTPGSVKLSGAFLASLKDSLTAPHLILDLRDNTGGAAAVSDKFLKLINRYAARGKVYVMINNGTMSRGEIFLLQLKGRKNIQTFGQTTNGTLAYGSNSGKTIRLPSGKFQVYITDMKDKRNHVLYENTGVKPDVWLEGDGDWTDKVVAWIKRHELK
jgi:C-terminal processing protease CtpA/Prc